MLQNAVNRRFQSADEVIKELECGNVGMLKVKSSNLTLEDSLPLRYQPSNLQTFLWKMSTGQEICTLSGHLDSVCAVTISSTGQVIALRSKDKTVKVWQRMG